MKWRGKRQSSNIEDKRSQQTRAGLNLGAIIPIIRFLLSTKIGRIILVVGVVAYFLGFNPLSLLNTSSAVSTQQIDKSKDDEAAQFVATVLAQTEDVWNQIFTQNGAKYKEPNLVLFRGAVDSGCGFASSQVGPFYCPADQKVYLDLSFFDELAKRHDAPGDFAQAYVIAHEIGHHVQQLLGTLNQSNRAKQLAKSQTAQNAIQVKIELQADCYSGIWAHYLDKDKNLLEDGDINEALNAASMIGDDTLQKKYQGHVVPDSFTHGSSQQRKAWFYKGFQTGSLKSCQIQI
ncbi:KPN_02809 family neutral zinc metallopeptidase [Campylobacter geochelonis]|uniref:Zinc protease n=1 Tax=Campylobacter geochelonis TaxID=1780362 RepID=A0A128EBS5_9BACT|nr:neutral zinc metallopeptidase [Campylobacter geochelonis]QKF70359.1 putative neutral zinc metallopeptidase [Campylobacter geochelonis]CZE46444.1 zinc protease [Campylobacter geochelonis]